MLFALFARKKLGQASGLAHLADWRVSRCTIVFVKTTKKSPQLGSFTNQSHTFARLKPAWPRSTMDSIRVSEAPDPGSIPGEAT